MKMKNINVKIVSSFSIGNSGGNKAGVVLNADNLTNIEKQKIAALVGVSETAFVSSSEIADFKLDFFTPVKQIPHCGHATVATFSLLKQLNQVKGIVSSKETIDGTREISFAGNLAFMEQKAPQYIYLDDYHTVLKLLGISKNELHDDLTPMIVNTGNSFLMLPVKDIKTLQNVSPDLNAILKYSERHNGVGVYTFTPINSSEYDAETRMFAPLYGINEEAATGMAAGPLACYMHKYLNAKKEYHISQGKLMPLPSPSSITVKLAIDSGKISKLFAGGNAYVEKEVTISI